jgi:hypothetical protein
MAAALRVLSKHYWQSALPHRAQDNRCVATPLFAANQIYLVPSGQTTFFGGETRDRIFFAIARLVISASPWALRSPPTKTHSVSLFLVCVLDTTLLRTIPQFTKRNDRQEAQPTLLVGHESLIKWLPRRGELFEISRSLSQGIGASIQKLDRVAVAQGIDCTTISPPSQACCDRFKPGHP